MTFLCGLMR